MQALKNYKYLDWSKRDEIADAASSCKQIMEDISWFVESMRKKSDEPAKISLEDIRSECLSVLYDEINPILDQLDKAIKDISDVNFEETKNYMMSCLLSICSRLKSERYPNYSYLRLVAELALIEAIEASKDIIDMASSFIDAENTRFSEGE